MTARARRRHAGYSTWPAILLLAAGIIGLGGVGAHAATADPVPCVAGTEVLQICTTADIELVPLSPTV